MLNINKFSPPDMDKLFGLFVKKIKSAFEKSDKNDENENKNNNNTITKIIIVLIRNIGIDRYLNENCKEKQLKVFII